MTWESVWRSGSCMSSTNCPTRKRVIVSRRLGGHMRASQAGTAGGRWSLKRTDVIWQKKGGSTALSDGCRPAETGQRDGLKLYCARKRERQLVLRRETNLFAFRRQHG